MRGDKILATMFQLFMAAIIIYTLYVQDARLAFYILGLVLLIIIWKQYMIQAHPSLCSLAKKIHC